MEDSTKEQKEFENRWHCKLIIKNSDYDSTEYPDIKDQIYLVTAALYNYEPGTTIFAIIGETYKPTENPCWYAYHISNDKLEKFLSYFETIGDAPDNIKEMFKKENMR